jgi:hypothetical protein
MQVRVPRIARDLLAQNASLPARIRDAVEALAQRIELDAAPAKPGPPAPDVAEWTAAWAEHAGETWLSAEWFYAELAFYRELLQVVRFWETGRDPFEPAKEEELAGGRPWTRLEEALEGAGLGPPRSLRRDERILALLDACLWGNRVDLSYAVAASRAGRTDDDLLVDERAAAVPLLVRAGARVHLVADNTGAELALDLALVDAVLEEPTSSVTIHVKLQPVFVSDATGADIWRMLRGMHERGGDARSLAARLRGAFDAERLALAPDPFWSSPRFLWHAPAHVRESLSSADIVVLKGDANYRRAVGDALWPPETPFAQAVAYASYAMLCLRTMKSDSVLGLPAGLAEKLEASDARWRIDGCRGVAQAFVP